MTSEDKTIGDVLSELIGFLLNILFHMTDE